MSDVRQVKVTTAERRAFDAYVRAGVLEVVGRPVYRGDVLYATVRRAEVAPQEHGRPVAWTRPVAIVTGLAGVGAGVAVLVAHLVRIMTNAVTQAGPALGFLLALSLVVFLAVALRRRAGRTVTVTTVTKVRVR